MFVWWSLKFFLAIFLVIRLFWSFSMFRDQNACLVIRWYMIHGSPNFRDPRITKLTRPRKSSYFILPTVSRRLVVSRIKQHISKAYISLNKTNTKSFTFNWKMALFYLKRRVRVLELKMRKKIIFHKKTNITLIVFSRAF